MAKKRKKLYEYIPRIISTSDLQKGAGRVLNLLRKSTASYFIVRNNQPEGVAIKNA